MGRTAGRVGDPDLNRAIVSTALSQLVDDTPGSMVDLPYHWAGTDDWKDKVMRVEVDPSGSTSTNDDRVQRVDTPQYQSGADADAAATTHAGHDCLVCQGIDY